MIPLLLGMLAIKCPWCGRSFPLVGKKRILLGKRFCRGCGRKIFTLI